MGAQRISAHIDLVSTLDGDEAIGNARDPERAAHVLSTLDPREWRLRVADPNRLVAILVDPLVDVVGVEPEEMAPFDVGDTSFVNESADVADVHAKGVGDFADRDECHQTVLPGSRTTLMVV